MTGSRVAGIGLAIGCVLLGVGSLALLRSNGQLRASLQQASALIQPEIGASVPPLDGKDYLGRAVAIGSQPPRKALILVFTGECPLCGGIWSNWEKVLRVINSHNIRVNAVDLQPDFLTTDFIDQHGLAHGTTFTTGLDPADITKYHLRLVPQTIVVSPNGRITWVHTGNLDAAQYRSLLESLGVQPSD